MHANRDHLFISYAWEDHAFVDWLALKLTAAGYLVWRDQTKLLGGEPYPTDIDTAIKQHTFRLLAVLSRHSIHKENPRKERTLALNLARDRRESDFVIPLNIDGLKPTELDWMTSDLSFIPFADWSEGLRSLLKKLDSISAPRPLDDGKDLVSTWIYHRDTALLRRERLRSNVFPIVEMPTDIFCVSSSGETLYRHFGNLPFVRQSDIVFWSFELPHSLPPGSEVSAHPWRMPRESPAGEELAKKVSRLLRLYMWNHYAKRGLQKHRDEKRTFFYFSPESDGKRKLGFTTYTGRRSWVQAAGERRFKAGIDLTETNRYHLMPDLIPRLYDFDSPTLLLRLHVHLTDVKGVPLPTKKAFRRRKKIVMSWWNHHWLSRQLAVMEWLSEGQETFYLTEPGSERPIRVSASPHTLSSAVGINELSGDTSDEHEDSASSLEDDIVEDEDDL